MPGTEETTAHTDEPDEIDNLITTAQIMRTRVAYGCAWLTEKHPEWLALAMTADPASPMTQEALCYLIPGGDPNWGVLAVKHGRPWMVYRGFAPDWDGEHGPAYTSVHLSAAWLAAFTIHKAHVAQEEGK